METVIQSEPVTPEQQQRRIDDARAFATEAASLAANTRCTQVVILQVGVVSSLTDFFVIGTGTSARQMRTVCDDLEELAGKHGFELRHASGLDGDSWMALDFADVVVHLFSPEARQFYDLDGLWADAPRIPFDPAAFPSRA